MSEQIETTQGLQQWEYKTLFSRYNEEEELAELGEQGWEAYATRNSQILLKRPKKATQNKKNDYGYSR